MNTSRRATLLAPAMIIVELTACTATRQGAPSASSNAADPDRPAPTQPIVAPVPSGTAGVVGEMPAEQLEAIRADAANRTGIDPADIETVRAQAMTWPDGSLGCPEPGQAYTQALVDGYHVVLDAAGESLDYRATAGGGFRLCDDSGRPAES